MKKFVAGLAVISGLFLLPCTIIANPYAGAFRAMGEEFEAAQEEVQNRSAGVTAVLGEYLQEAIDEKNYISEEAVSDKNEDANLAQPCEYSDNVKLIARITLAEAEGESEYGMRLVIDTILNRVASDDFPDTIPGVIYQKNQFSCVWNGRANNVGVEDYICNMVLEEMANRTDPYVRFFRTKHYGYGTPYAKVGHHYFST